MVSKRKGKNKILKNLIKFEIIALVIFTVGYLVFAFVFNPRFILNDFKEKFLRAADTVVCFQITDKPAKPVIAAASGCNNNDNAYINLSWAATTDTDDYDIYRDSEILISGIGETEYTDNTVSLSANYTYQLVANGPMGTTSSDEITVSVIAGCQASVAYTCQIRKVGKESVVGNKEPGIKDRTPKISGTTSIPNAIIIIEISGKTDVSATTIANINGYWSWAPSEKLKYGSYEVQVSAIDPVDSSLTASDDAKFKIVEEEKEAEQLPEIKQPPKNIPSEEPTTKPEEEKPEIKFSIFLNVENEGKSAYSGNELDLKVKINQEGDIENAELVYAIFDEEGKQVYQISDNQKLEGKFTLISKKLPISKLTPAGKYRVEVKVVSDDFFATAEDYFFLKEAPVITVGPTEITFTDIMKNISMIILWLLLLLLLFLFLLLRERYLASRALRFITENSLKENGFFTERKEVQR